MGKSFKKIVSLLVALVITLSFLGAGVIAFGDDDVSINAINFPDDTFRALIKDRYDTNDDGVLSASERKVSRMSISGLLDDDEVIKDLTGIEYFSSLETLYCGGIGLETLDVSKLTNLTSLTCHGNNLTTLDLSSNTKLLFVNCGDNKLESLLLPAGNKIETLYCFANSLTSLDTDRLKGVKDLMCYQNELTYLDTSALEKLEYFNCSINHIPSLDLSNTALEEVTEYMIGEQTITLQASFDGTTIEIPFTNHGLNASNFISCSLDAYDDGAGFEFDKFTVYDVDEIKDGITYECSTNLAGSEAMEVTVEVLRDFYQVNFYANEEHTRLLGKTFVNAGESATAPTDFTLPQCKSFNSWSESFDVVNSDLNVYAIWDDSHSYVAYALGTDGDTVTVRCSDCGDSYTVSFISIANSKTGDEKFDENVDVVADGYINAKDYAELTKLNK